MAEIWQIGAGDKEKDLVPTMLESGLMIIGPGNGGDISSLDDQTLENNLRKTGEIEEKHIKSTVIFLKAFRDANEREIVVLKLGSVCFAVGAIAGKYKWDNEEDLTPSKIIFFIIRLRVRSSIVRSLSSMPIRLFFNSQNVSLLLMVR